MFSFLKRRKTFECTCLFNARLNAAMKKPFKFLFSLIFLSRQYISHLKEWLMLFNKCFGGSIFFCRVDAFVPRFSCTCIVFVFSCIPVLAFYFQQWLKPFNFNSLMVVGSFVFLTKWSLMLLMMMKCCCEMADRWKALMKEILTVANLQYTTARSIWICALSDFRLCWMKLCSSESLLSSNRSSGTNNELPFWRKRWGNGL